MLPSFFDNESSLDIWESSRRKEILDYFAKEVYGIVPNFEYSMTSKVENEYIEDNIKNQVVKLSIHVYKKTYSFKMFIYTSSLSDNNIPSIILLNPFSQNPNFDHKKRNREHMPYKDIVRQGYGAIYAYVDEICIDDKDMCKQGILEISTNEDKSQWGAVSAWAWAGSRVVDYIYSRSDFDKQHIGICGFSRGGKASLWCGAQDQRISLVFSASSGCTGSAITRNKRGETIKDITTQFPHWFCENYNKYRDNEESLKVDQHMLLGCIAPRNLYISSSELDEWADPDMEFLSLIKAGEIYRLYKEPSLTNGNKPNLDFQYISGKTGYHIRQGKHELNNKDWNFYLEFYKHICKQ